MSVRYFKPIFVFKYKRTINTVKELVLLYINDKSNYFIGKVICLTLNMLMLLTFISNKT